MNKNIWIINHYAYPPEYATNIRHFKFAEKLNDRGYKVKIVAASSLHRTKKNFIKGKEKYLIKNYNGIEYISIRTSSYYGNGIKRYLNMLEFMVKSKILIPKITDDKPDVIYASSPNPLAWVSGYHLAKKYNSKFISEVRDIWPETLVKMGRLKENGIIAKMLYKLEKFIYKKSDSIIFTMEGGIDYIKDKGWSKEQGGSIDTNKIYNINNGIDLKEFDRNIEKNEYHDKYLDNNNFFKVVYTGSIGKANQVNKIIELAHESKDIKDIKFLIFGDGTEKIKLENLCNEKNIKNVIFYGRVEKKYIPSILDKSNLNIFSVKNIALYKYGLSLNKLFEYFASGKPIISNSNTGKYDLIKEYNCGISITDNNIVSLKEGILKFKNMDEEEYKKYYENSRKAVEDYDFEKLTNKLIKIIEK